ncbi:MAG: acetolactate decarboxylase [Nitrospirae bacterium YQR-1]
MRQTTRVIILFLILSGCVTHEAALKDTIYQTSTLDALLKGVNGGATDFAELKKHGDFGLGTFENLDGEMAALDGQFFQIKSDGLVYPVSMDMKTPFAVLKFFNTDMSFDIKKETSCDDLMDEISRRLPSINIFYAIRIDGIFEKIRARSVPAQKKPYPGLLEAVKTQTLFDYEGLNGTMLGFWFPDFIKDTNVTGFHFHFISTGRTQGGHLLSCKLKEGKVQIDSAVNLTLKLPETDEYLNTKAPKDNTTKVVSYH